jgi:hypothetical protein
MCYHSIAFYLLLLLDTTRFEIYDIRSMMIALYCQVKTPMGFILM